MRLRNLLESDFIVGVFYLVMGEAVSVLYGMLLWARPFQAGEGGMIIATLLFGSGVFIKLLGWRLLVSRDKP